MNTILTEKERRAVIRAVPFPPGRNWVNDVAEAIEAAVLAKLCEQDKRWADRAAHLLNVFDAAPQPAVVQVPQGWRLVPVEPTESMVKMGAEVIEDNGGNARWSDVREAWFHMLCMIESAAPEAPATAVVQVPPGYKLVPVEPTREMVRAGARCASSNMCWAEMLAAAPEAPAQAVSEREAFEAHEQAKYKYPNDGLTRYPDAPDQYALPLMQARWEGWQARAKAAAPEAPATAVVQVPQGWLDDLRIAMEHSAWDGVLQLPDALANIDDAAAMLAAAPEAPAQEGKQ